MKKFSFRDFLSGGFYLFVFLIPFQVKTLFFSPAIYHSGFFDPYLSHSIYLSDIVFAGFLFFFGVYLFVTAEKISFKGDRTLTFALILMFAFGVGNFFYFAYSVSSLFSLLRFLWFFLFFLILSFEIPWLCINQVMKALVISLSAIAVIGIAQFLLQASLGLNFIGEPILANDLLGVAKVQVLGEDFLRSYGTFSHPNLFAGFLVTVILWLLFHSSKSSLKKCVQILFISALCFSFSRSAFLALALGLILYVLTYVKSVKMKWGISILMSLCFIFILVFVNRDFSSFIERIDLLDISWEIFKDNPFGIGFGNFTLVIQDYFSNKLEPWLYQPVHNVFVLVFVEAGVFGGILFLSMLVSLLFRSLFGRKWFSLSLVLMIFVIGSFDHYFLTLYQGQFLFFLVLALITNKELSVPIQKL